MNDSNSPPPRRPFSLGNTLFMAGACIGLGSIALLIGLGIIPSGNTKHTAGSSLMAIGVGALFVFAGLMILVRDFGGAKNNEELPANAPAFLRHSASVLNIVLLAIFATVISAIAWSGTGSQSGAVAILFRVFLGAFALLLWYGVIYMALVKFRNRG